MLALLTFSRPLQRVVLSFDFPFYGHPLRQITIATGGKALSVGLGEGVEISARTWDLNWKGSRESGFYRWTGMGPTCGSLLGPHSQVRDHERFGPPPSRLLT